MSRKSTSFRYLSNKSCCLSHFPKTSHFARPTLCHCQSNGNPKYFVVFMLVWGGKKRRQNKKQPVDCFASRDTERRSEAVFIGMHLWHFKVLSQGFSIKCRELIKLIQPNFSHFGGGFLKWRWNSKQRKPQGQIQNWPKLGTSSEFWQAFVCIALGPVPIWKKLYQCLRPAKKNVQFFIWKNSFQQTPPPLLQDFHFHVLATVHQSEHYISLQVIFCIIVCEMNKNLESWWLGRKTDNLTHI